jgi:transcriptional regulator with XRE-family HTH domain
MDLGKRIREIRMANNQKLLNISQITGLSQPFISEIERGIKVPSLETLEKICTALGITLAEFFADTREREPLPPEIRQIIDKAQKLTPRQLKILNDVLDEWIEPKEAKK